MPKYANQRILSFKTIEGFTPMTNEEFAAKLEQIQHKHKEEFQALLILLYYTGCRPAEALTLQTKNFFIKKNFLWVILPALKGGETSIIPLSLKNPLIQKLKNYVFSYIPEYLVFQNLIGNSQKYKKIKTNEGTIKVPTAPEISHKIRPHVVKFFGVPPYFFRHNRLTIGAMRGATLRQLMQLKRAKSEKSVYPYLHYSITEKRKIAKFTA